VKKSKSFFLFSLLFIPLIITPTPSAIEPQPDIFPKTDEYFGLAMVTTLQADADLLGIDWFYVWGPTGPDWQDYPRIPMVWDGLPSLKIPRDYSSWILVLNEPNLQVQANVPPEEAMRRLTELRAYYPKAKLICCGLSAFASDYLEKFLAAGPTRPDLWHVHAYTWYADTPPVVQAQLTAMHDLTGGDYWITEYGSPEGNLGYFQEITELFLVQPWIHRIAPYTNRQPLVNEPWVMDKRVELVKDDGTLTPMGAYYRDFVLNRGQK